MLKYVNGAVYGVLYLLRIIAVIYYIYENVPTGGLKMSTEERKYIKQYPFYKEYVCPICEGRGAVECCNADGNDCVPVPCDYCGAKGTIVEKNVSGMVMAAVGAVAVIAVLLIVLL